MTISYLLYLFIQQCMSNMLSPAQTSLSPEKIASMINQFNIGGKDLIIINIINKDEIYC